MTAEEADARIIKSRMTLNAYKRNGIASRENAELFKHEIDILLGIAVEHDGKSAKISRLIGEWREYLAKVEGRTIH